jgi:hypothetical protein
MKLRHAVVLCASVLLSCTEAPKKQTAKEPEKPAEPVTGRYAFQQVFIYARTWAPDIQGLRVRNLQVGELKAEPGKSAAWEITLVSPSKNRQRLYTYSAVEEGNIHKGVFGGVEENYTQRGQARPWPIAALKIDSDAAYKTALARSAEYVKKNPDKPISFLLEQTPRHPNLAWRVIWGTSVATSNYSIYVDASTGAFLETMR